MKYKALISDVDGTLIGYQRDMQPTVRVKLVIAEACAKIHIGIATARPYFMVKNLIDDLQLTSPCILGNGVQIYDPVKRKVLIEHNLPTDHLKEIYQEIEKIGVECIIQERENRLIFSSTYQPNHPLYIFIPSIPLECKEEFMKNMDAIPNVIVHTMIGSVKGTFDYIISSEKATKQLAILEVAKVLGIETKEIIGIGDGYNDFPLLMACGLKVAMGNAVEELKAIADYIAPTVDEDGLAHVIEKFVLNKK